MKKYRMVETDVFRRKIMPETDREKRHRENAIALREQYGLQEFGIKEIVEIWREHSESMAAGWLEPSGKEEIERVFDVKLEEIKEKIR